MKNDKLGEAEKPKSHVHTRETTQAFAGCPSNTPSHWCKKSALSCDWRFQFTSSLIFISLLNLSGGLPININCHGDSVVELWKSLVWKTDVFPIPSKSMIHKSFSTEPWIVRQTSDFSMLPEESASTLLFQDSKVSRGFLSAGIPQWLEWSRQHKKKGTVWISFMLLQVIVFHTHIPGKHLCNRIETSLY